MYFDLVTEILGLEISLITYCDALRQRRDQMIKLFLNPKEDKFQRFKKNNVSLHDLYKADR